MVLPANIKNIIKRRAKTVAFSPAGHFAARTAMAVPEGIGLRALLRAGGMEDHVRRIASEKLPEGMYYAKLTIRQWKSYEGKPFRLFMGEEIVYGNQVEAPPEGRPLEYRNIIVNSRNAADFRLDIDVPYKLAISKGSYTTAQQAEYDRMYNVVQHGDAFYSLRGNIANPTKMLITFPGFSMSTARISYNISNLKNISDIDLSETIMICFQDRYLSAGSYMMVDNSGNPLYNRVHQIIEDLRSKHAIDHSEMLLFGVSKGGSMALYYAQGFPQAQLLLAVPQMDLPCYFNKPFFRDNLFTNPLLQSVEQPKELLQEYFEQGRRIDYFYTNDDELSNQSVIEFATDVPNLTKYRVAGVHGAVAGSVLPAMLGIMRDFLMKTEENTFACEEVRTFAHGNELQVQLRVDQAASKISGANWFLEGSLGRTRFMQILTEHSYDFIKFTASDQQIFADHEHLDEVAALTAIEASGARWRSELTSPIHREASAGTGAHADSEPLQLDSIEIRNYAILDGKKFSRFRYSSRCVADTGEAVEVHFVPDLETSGVYALGATGENTVSHVVHVQALDGGSLADLMALRLVIGARATKLIIVVHEGALGMESCESLVTVDWVEATVVFAGSGSAFREGALAFSAWNAPERISVVDALT